MRRRELKTWAFLAFTAVWLIANAMVLYRNAFIHHVQLQLLQGGHSQPTPGDSAQPLALATPQAFFQHLAAAVDWRLNITAWLDFAQRDALQHGVLVSDRCSTQLGLGFLDSFSQSRGALCGQKSDRTHQQHVSSVECAAYPVHQQGVACWAENLLVNSSSFLGPKRPQGHQDHNKYVPIGTAGSVKADCHKYSPADTANGTVWRTGAGKNLQKELLPWFTSAFETTDAEAVEAACHGSSHVVHHPVVFVTRLDTTNPYHHTQSLIQAFLTLAVGSLKDAQQLQVIIADHFEAGPFTDIWQRISDPFPVMRMDDPSLAGRLTCFKHSIHAHYVGPGKAFLGYEGIGSEHDCPSTLLMAAAHWQRYLFKDTLQADERLELESIASAAKGPVGKAVERLPKQQSPSAAANHPHRRLNVVWLSRSWFSRGMKAGGGLTGWQASRDMSAEQEGAIALRLEQAVLQWNNRACVQPVFGWWQEPHQVPRQTLCKPTNVSFDFRFMELSVEDLNPDQLFVLTRTAVLVGVHGAALTNQIWMRPHRGAVVEFGAGGNYHYRNMAFELGHKHFRVGTAEADVLASVLEEAMDDVSSKY